MQHEPTMIAAAVESAPRLAPSSGPDGVIQTLLGHSDDWTTNYCKRNRSGDTRNLVKRFRWGEGIHLTELVGSISEDFCDTWNAEKVRVRITASGMRRCTHSSYRISQQERRVHERRSRYPGL
jgi:hypothetical protein